ncbi:MAG: hypothetical protein ACRCXZ_06730 [Patescibacteria group bacterium]
MKIEIYKQDKLDINIRTKTQLFRSKKELKSNLPTDFLSFVKLYGIVDLYSDNGLILSPIGDIVPTNEEVRIWKFDGYQIPFHHDPEFGFYILNLRKLKDGLAPVYILSNQEFVEAGCYPEYSLELDGLDYNNRENEPDYTKDSLYFYPTKYKSFTEWLEDIDSEDFELIM